MIGTVAGFYPIWTPVGSNRLRSNATMRRTIAMGQAFAFIVSISAIGAGTYLASLGHNNQGIAAIVIALGFPIALFLYRRVTGR
ncbi:MAG: hypothetical protein Q8O42_09025 [Acidobacteriota bacterium]|nr:hypothetical protein [Acidobacteriota bacterium]